MPNYSAVPVSLPFLNNILPFSSKPTKTAPAYKAAINKFKASTVASVVFANSIFFAANSSASMVLQEEPPKISSKIAAFSTDTSSSPRVALIA